METLARWGMNLFFGSIFTFYGSLFLLFLFRPLIKSPRALYLFYLLPLFRMITDALFSSHSLWMFRSGESLLNQPENSRMLSALVGYQGTYPFVSLKFHLQNGHLFSIGDLFFELAPPFLTHGMLIFIALGSIRALFRFGLKIPASISSHRKIRRGLIFWNTFRDIPVYLSGEPLSSPFISGLWKPLIVFPENLLSRLSDEERNAVLLHEANHALWKDNVVQWVVLLIHAFFWFIPFKAFWARKAFHYRELGCDQKCNPKALAGAIYKIGAPPSLPPAVIAFSTSYDRVQRALCRKKQGYRAIILSFILLLGGATLIFLSEFLPF